MTSFFWGVIMLVIKGIAMFISNNKDIIFAIAAFVGMSLGLYNLIYERVKERVRLMVIPKSTIKKIIMTTGHEGYITSKTDFDPFRINEYFAIEIINRSRFPVVVSEVGFTGRFNRDRMAIMLPITFDNVPWPRKLEPRSSLTAYGLFQELVSSGRFDKIKYAYVKTECDTICFGTSKALKRAKKFYKDNESQ